MSEPERFGAYLGFILGFLVTLTFAGIDVALWPALASLIVIAYLEVKGGRAK